MRLTPRITWISSLLALVVLTGACGAADESAAPSTREPWTPPDPEEPDIEESDIYKILGDHMYVQNPTSGLNILDIAKPSRPRLVGRAPTGGMAGTEIYVNPMWAFVLVDGASSSCELPGGLTPDGWSFGTELVVVSLASLEQPVVAARYCLPGKLVASRMVDLSLYLVTSQAGRSRALSIDLRDPMLAQLVRQHDIAGQGAEIHLTPHALVVATRTLEDYQANTSLQYIEVDGLGRFVPRGSVTVRGEPQGRFHMSLEGSYFYIVTYDLQLAASRLSVVQTRNPDALEVVGGMCPIGAGERLYATRFVGDRAYVVTYRQTDPLWIISLEEPTQPRLLGELHVPGWSDFIFPRGDRLVTVGRGDRGTHLGVSLFDVSDPAAPRALAQVSLGDPSATSEANVDHRAVTLLEQPDGHPVVVVPHTSVSYSGGCEVKDVLQLVEVTDSGLWLRGSVRQRGTIRRTAQVQSALYSISDHEVLALDIANLDVPRVEAEVTVGLGTPDSAQGSGYCDGYYDQQPVWMDDEADGGFFMFGCNAGGQGRDLPPLSLLVVGLLALGLQVRRRRA